MLKIKKHLIGVILFITLGAKAQDKLIINGTIDKNLNGRVLQMEYYLLDSNNITSTLISQESVIKDEKFSFSFPVKTIEKYNISLKGQNKDIAFISRSTFMFEPKITTIKFLDTLLKKYEVTGNDINEQYNGTFKLSNRALFAQYEVNKNLISLIQSDPSSPLNIYHLLSINKYITEKETIRLFNLIPDNVKINSAGRELKFIIENLFIDQIAPDFEQADTNGKKIKLSELRGNYVLLDFWGSWCNPCRKEHPDLNKAFNKYNKKGFEILSFSTNESKESWLKAIREDSIANWKNVAEFKGENDYVSKHLYKVIAVPVNFLIDPNGKIIAKNLSGKDLFLKLSELKL